jgi:tetratricopeptide (TPR) repeat protein
MAPEDSKEIVRIKTAQANMYLEWGRWKKATEVLLELSALGTDGEPFKDWEGLGDAYFGLGEYVKAITAYKQINPQNQHCTTRAVAYLGRAYGFNGQHDLQIRELKRAARLVQGDHLRYSDRHALRGDVHVWLAEAYEATNQADTAREQYVHAEAGLGIAMEKLARIAGAGGQSLYRIQARDLAMLAFVLEKLGRADEARGSMAAAVEVFAQTTHEDDDDMERSEHVDAAAELERLSRPVLEPALPLSLEQRQSRLQRNLVFERRSNWAVKKSKPPPHKRPCWS